jgi:hypothetical protein
MTLLCMAQAKPLLAIVHQQFQLLFVPLRFLFFFEQFHFIFFYRFSCFYQLSHYRFHVGNTVGVCYFVHLQKRIEKLSLYTIPTHIVYCRNRNQFVFLHDNSLHVLWHQSSIDLFQNIFRFVCTTICRHRQEFLWGDGYNFLIHLRIHFLIRLFQRIQHLLAYV